jgi:serine protease
MKTPLQISIIMLFLLAFDLTGQSQNTLSKIRPGQAQAREPMDSVMLSAQCVHGMITVKLKKSVGEFRNQTGTVRFGIPSLDAKVANYQVNQLDKRFRYNPAKLREGLPDLSRIYKISFPENFSLSEVIKAFSSDPNVEYAEAIPIDHVFDVPTDSLYSQLQHLPQIFAPQAWAIHKGQNGTDPIVIAINDTGVDWDHVDLVDNIWQNLAEDADNDGHTIEFNGTQWVLDPGDLNGIDDDGNGFKDDLVGWNFMTTTGDPTPIPSNPVGSHGTHCAGIADGRTNNDKGISSISWNVKVMGICVDQNNTVPYAWDGIIYAAENGADIISNSWGGFPYSNANQEVITYASGLGSIVVAAAGNSNYSLLFYPADYLHVISVASVSVDDSKASYSCFNHAVDIAAPGGGSEGGILSTIPGNQYGLMSGTSMATPLVAGCLGLLKSYHPSWTNNQLITQLLGTADNIDAINPNYVNTLGSGRVNAYRMLAEQNVTMPYLKLDLLSFNPADANGNGMNEPGENVTLNFTLQNYIQCTGANNVTFSITTLDPDITILDGTGTVNIPADSSFSILNQLQIKVGATATCHFAQMTIHFQSTLQILTGKDINFEVLVAPSGILVFEGEQNGHDYSGKFISEFLDHYGYNYAYTNNFPPLLGFETVFLSFGNIGQYSDKGTPLTQSNSAAIEEFLKSGGNVYLEMGGMFYYIYNYPDRDTLKLLLGVNSIALSNLENQIDTLRGVTGTPTAGMLFAGSDQKYNWHIDRVTTRTGAFIAFKEQNYGSGNVAIMYDGTTTHGQKSFYMGYTLADLRDRDTSSSRYNVLLKTMDFFGYPRPQGYLLSNFIPDKRVGGVPLQVHFTDISLSDPAYSVASWQWDFDNDGVIDSHDRNPDWTYNAAGSYSVKLITTNGFKSDTLVKVGLISVNTGYLVYEGEAGGHDYSGSFIRDYLNQEADPVTYVNTLPGSLAGYSAAFFSFGNAMSGYTVLDKQMAGIISGYLDNGGYVYLEGDAALGYDQASNTHLRQLFGLASASLGSTNPIDSLKGQPGALTDGMLFTGNSQRSNSYIDLYTPAAGATAAFIESNYGIVAVQNSVTNAHRTFCFSYALSRLDDGEAPNSRNELLRRILNFFDIYTAAPDGKRSDAMHCIVYPNPMKTTAIIRYNLKEDSQVTLEIFNSTGQKIMQPVNRNQIKGEHCQPLNAGGLPAGFYYYSLSSGKQTSVGKIIVMK